MSLCLFLFVRRRTSSLSALCAAAFPLTTIAYYYAFEARAYGMVMGFAAVALVAWQSAALGRHRIFSLVCLAASLSGALASHYYAVLVILPFALGELTRSAITRRIDIPVWGSLVFPGLPLVLHLPLIGAGEAYAGTFWAPPQWVNIPDFYSHLLSPAVPALAFIALLGFVHAVTLADQPAICDERSRGLPIAEIVAACGFMAIPVISVVLAKVATGAFTDRYAIPAILGFAVVAGFGTAVAFRRSALLRAATLVSLIAWFVFSQARELIEPTGFSLPVSAATIHRPTEWLKTAPGSDLPVVVADPHTFTVLSHYGDREVKSRIVYLADRTLALQQLGHNSVERGMLDLLKPWFHMNVVEFEPFLAEHPRFLLYGDFFRMAFLNWMTPELQRRGMRLELLNRQGDNLLLLVDRTR